MVVYYDEAIMRKNWFTIFNVKVTWGYLLGQGHSDGSYDQNMTLSAIFSELLIPWQPILV